MKKKPPKAKTPPKPLPPYDPRRSEEVLQDFYDELWAWINLHYTLLTPEANASFKAILTKALDRYGAIVSHPDRLRQPIPGPKPKQSPEQWLMALEEGLAQAEREGRLTRRVPPLLPLYEGHPITTTEVATFIMPPGATDKQFKAAEARAAQWMKYKKGLDTIPLPDLISVGDALIPGLMLNVRTGKFCPPGLVFDARTGKYSLLKPIPGLRCNPRTGELLVDKPRK